MYLTIYREISALAVIQTDKAQLSQKVKGEDMITVSFTRPTYIAFNIGDYISYNGNRYAINTLPTVDKLSTNKYSYTIVFESLLYELGKVQYMFEGRGEFDLVTNAQGFISLIVTNMNRVQSGWELGTTVSSDYKNIHFSNENCLSVIQRLAQEFDTEFYIAGSTGKEINFEDYGADNGLTFEYGFNKGLYSINRNTINSKNIVTRLYAFGSQKNLPVYYRDTANMSDRLIFVDSGGDSFIEKNTDLYGTIEFAKNFDEIYPHRTGTISSVHATDVLKFTDSGMDFDLNDQLLPGLTAKVHFQTGLLGGYELEISNYNNSTKEFTLVLFDDGKAGKLPNESIKPAAGDKYVLIDIEMPQTYIDAAEAELLVAANNYLDQNSAPRVQYSVKCDPIYFKNESAEPSIGDYVTIVDTDFGLNRLIRITELKRDLVIPSAYDIVLSDTVEVGALSRMYADSLETKRIIENPKIALRDNFKVKRNWRNIEELRTMVFDADDYFDMGNIRPLSIETNMLSVGSKSGNFTIRGVVIDPNYLGDKSKINIGSGYLDHYTIADTITTWTITGALTTGLTDGTAYYLYAKCNRTGSDATIVVDSTQRKADDDASWYYFVIGVLHSVVDGVRGISLTYGQTTINGKFITTGRIQDVTGAIYFDLENALISALDAGLSGSGESDDEVRFWAGDTYENRDTAPWKVLQDGTMIVGQDGSFYFVASKQETTLKVVYDTINAADAVKQMAVADGYGAFRGVIQVRGIGGSGTELAYMQMSASSSGAYLEGKYGQFIEYTADGTIRIGGTESTAGIEFLSPIIGNTVFSEPPILPIINDTDDLPNPATEGMEILFMYGGNYRKYYYMNSGWRYVSLTT